MNAVDRTGDVGLAIDHIAVIDHDGRNLGDAQPPSVGDPLIGIGKLPLQTCTALSETLPDDGFGLRGISRKLCAECGLQVGWCIEQHHTNAVRVAHWMLRVGEGDDVSGLRG